MKFLNADIKNNKILVLLYGNKSAIVLSITNLYINYNDRLNKNKK